MIHGYDYLTEFHLKCRARLSLHDDPEFKPQSLNDWAERCIGIFFEEHIPNRFQSVMQKIQLKSCFCRIVYFLSDIST